MFARRQWERNDLALLVSSVPKALSRAAHLLQQMVRSIRDACNGVTVNPSV